MIALGTVHPGTVAFGYHSSVAALLKEDPRAFRLVSQRSGAEIARARNAIFWYAALTPDIDTLLFIDSDMVFEPNDVFEVVGDANGHRYGMVAGLCAGVHEDGTPFNAVHARDPEGGWRRDDRIFTLPSLYEVDGVGMAFCAIGQKVLDHFAGLEDQRSDLFPFSQSEHRGVVADVDITFCGRVLDAGFTIAVDPTVRIGHVKEVVVYP